jgi:tetratricopeptide (TPR) repeat protein
MRSRSVLCVVALCGLGLIGCGQPVREDRSVTFSKDGNQVGFQHNEDGVFLASKDGGAPVKIFQPDANILATSTPLWSPDGQKVIFTSARSQDGTPPVRNVWPFGATNDPAGRIQHKQPIVYTCWLCDRSKPDQEAKPVALFEAKCDHAGYVAANLAVRWHPTDERIVFVQQELGWLHTLYEFDVSTHASRRVFPLAAEALLFDWAPDRRNLCCVVATGENNAENGIWIGPPGAKDWWHVPNSDALARGEQSSKLEQLRATRPAWTADGARFAFASHFVEKGPNEPARHALHLGTLATRQVDALADGPKPFRDLFWAPDGERLGVVQGDETGSLHIARRGQPLSQAINRRPVRRFAGWSAAGRNIAYIVPDQLADPAGESWAFLLPPDPLARDAVLLADGDRKEPAKEIFSGMRVTFPTWSPTEDKLSLWFTFCPTHRSWVSRFFGWGLRPGDPAAVFDVQSGKISWLAVNAYEKAQIGHYHLLKRDYAEALRWYEQATKEQPPRSADATSRLMEDLTDPRDFRVFHSYCLSKLNREKEAQAKLAEFEKDFLQLGPPKPAGDDIGQPLRELFDAKSIVSAMLRDLYVAEVFLSLDAAGDGAKFFQDRLAGGDEIARLSRALALSQFLLVERKHADYAELATGTIAPLCLKILKSQPGIGGAFNLDARSALAYHAGLALLPLYTPEFLSKLPEDKLQALVPRWQALQAQATDDTTRLGFDLFLLAAATRLGKENERRTVDERVHSNPAYSQYFAAGGAPEAVKKLREAIAATR